MATGRPIISTPVKDVVRQWSDIVSIVKTAEEFIAGRGEAAERRSIATRDKLRKAWSCQRHAAGTTR